MTAEQLGLVDAHSGEAAPGDLLPGWVRLTDKACMQSACQRVRIYRAQPTPSATQQYMVFVRLAGEWARLRSHSLDLADAAATAVAVLNDLREVPGE